MSRNADPQAPSTSNWVDRVRTRERAVPPTAKTDETCTDDDVHTAHTTAKTDETPRSEGIASVSAVTPRVYAETSQPQTAEATMHRMLVNRGVLMTIGHYHGYPLLPLKPSVSIAAGSTAWRTFTRFSGDAMLALAANAALAIWGGDPMVGDLYYTPLTAEHEENSSLEKHLAGCCTPGKPCPDHVDDVIEDRQDARLDRHLEHGTGTGTP